MEGVIDGRERAERLKSLTARIKRVMRGINIPRKDYINYDDPLHEIPCNEFYVHFRDPTNQRFISLVEYRALESCIQRINNPDGSTIDRPAIMRVLTIAGCRGDRGNLIFTLNPSRLKPPRRNHLGEPIGTEFTLEPESLTIQTGYPGNFLEDIDGEEVKVQEGIEIEEIEKIVIFLEEIAERIIVNEKPLDRQPADIELAALQTRMQIALAIGKPTNK